MVKKTAFTLILIIFLTAVYSHGNAKDVPLDKINDILQEQTSLKTMEQADDRKLMQFMGLNSSMYSEFLYYQGTEALSVDELLIIKVKNKNDLSGIKDAVEKRIEEQIKTFESYGPVQVSLLKNAIIETKGNYLFYCTGKDAEKYKEVFFHAI